MSDAAWQATDGLHLLRLAELLFEKMAFADVLGDHQADLLPRVFQLVGCDFDFEDLSVFLSVLPIALITPGPAPLLGMFKKFDFFFFAPNVQNLLPFKFIM